jgi:hypothetical protein
MAIYCPLCAWHPGPEARWLCRPGCGMLWNTFATRAICPRCYKLWRETWCLRCRLPSLHEAWYHEGLSDESEEQRATTIDAGDLLPV